MYFVNQKKHTANGWDNNCHTKDTKEQAMHQFHAFMSTYGYGQDASVDYASCSVESISGGIEKSEVDNRMSTDQEA